MMKRSRVLIAVAVAQLGLPGLSSAQTTNSSSAQVAYMVMSAERPAGAEGLGVQWLKVAAPGVGDMLVAVARPTGKGPFPTILLLHGTHGFAREYVQLAQALAHEGVLAMAACWFTGGSGAGMRAVTPIACPQAPRMPAASSDAAIKAIGVLFEATTGLPNIRAPMAVFGHSRGGGAALNYALKTGKPSAAVLDSCGYPSELAERVSQLEVPVLILHGVADSPADGGVPMTNIQMARNFEVALRRAGKPVEARYYEGSGHNGIFQKPDQAADSVQRIAAFVKRYAQR